MEETKLIELVRDAQHARERVSKLAASVEERELAFVLRVCDFFIGLPSPLVQAVIAPDAPCPLPMAPAYIRGLVPYSEGALAIVDIARFLELGAVTIESGMSRVVVVRSGDLEAGLLCDQALGVHTLGDESVGEAGVVRGGQLPDYTVSEWQLPFGRVASLDLTRLLDAMQLRA